jgi:hypothetical protein
MKVYLHEKNKQARTERLGLFADRVQLPSDFTWAGLGTAQRRRRIGCSATAAAMQAEQMRMMRHCRGEAQDIAELA